MPVVHANPSAGGHELTVACQNWPLRSGHRVAAGFGSGWVSLANLMSKAALYGSLSRTGTSRCNSAERQESSAYRIQPITIV
jgi:hypothetical protein